MAKKLPIKPTVTNKEEKHDLDKFFVSEGDSNFSEDYNKFVIQKSIEEAEVQRLKRKKEMKEQIAERVDAVTSYLFSMKAGSMPIDKYLGKKWLAHLRGQKIIEKLQRTKDGKNIVVLDSI